MYNFMEIVSDVMRVVTFQPERRPGQRLPARERHDMHGGDAERWADVRRHGRR